MKRPDKPSNRKPVDADIVVGANLRKLRIERGLTLDDLATTLGMSHQQLQKYETGANRVSAGVLYNLARCFVIPIEELFEDRDVNDTPHGDELSRARRKCRTMIDKTSSLEALATMDKVLRAMAEGRD